MQMSKTSLTTPYFEILPSYFWWRRRLHETADLLSLKTSQCTKFSNKVILETLTGASCILNYSKLTSKFKPLTNKLSSNHIFYKSAVSGCLKKLQNKKICKAKK